tara:strand:- start:577 stop:825 length:249 start_codon:yes stop_codon:yes gene_type:complete
MNYHLIIIACIFILLGICHPVIENFKLRRARPRHKIQVGTLNNTPKEMKGLMVGLNKVGGQLSADAKYDTVADDYLNKDNVE